MGLAYTKYYLDFESEAWKQVSNDPPIFESTIDGNNIEIPDVSGRIHNLSFKKGGQLTVLRVAGKFRLLWDDESLTAS